jgi:hypothetical protein
MPHRIDEKLMGHHLKERVMIILFENSEDFNPNLR